MDKNKAKELSEILKAFSDGKIIQRQDRDGWHDISETYLKYFIKKFDEQILRIKPEPKLVPFTFEDRDLFKDRWFRRKTFQELSKPISIQGGGVFVYNLRETKRISYEELLNNYEFEDRSPYGKYMD